MAIKKLVLPQLVENLRTAEQLLTSRACTVYELADAINCHRRNALRYIGHLTELGAEITEETGVGERTTYRQAKSSRIFR